MSGSPVCVGVDFGTSNSAIATTHGCDVTFAQFSLLGHPTSSYRSLLFFDPDLQEPGDPLEYSAGTEGIEAYLEALGEGRLIQSFKSHLTSSVSGRTQIGPHTIDLDDMLVLFLSRLRAHASRAFGADPSHAVFGRPVHFVDAKTAEDDERAQARLDAAARKAGFGHVTFELEPLGAAFHYERSLVRDELVLVADFGGGTTDFCIMKLGPGRERAEREGDIVATGGVGIAGDDFDAALIENVVAPALGKGSVYTNMGRDYTIPSSYYYKLSHWHHLSFLRGEQTRAELERLTKLARDPAPIAGLLHIIEANQGFHLHKAVERCKVELSEAEEGTFAYDDGPVSIRVCVRRQQFEAWIAPLVDSVETCLHETLSRAGLRPEDVDRVFMTGGTALVPAVRQIFASCFGPAKIAGGDELLSIASGLALRAQRRWAARRP